MNETQFNQLLTQWGRQTQLRELEAAATLPCFEDRIDPLPVPDGVDCASWISFWGRINDMLQRVMQIEPYVLQQCVKPTP